MTAAEGGSTAADTAPTNAASSSYGAGGVGGKFRKKPFRGRQSTPYDRPSTAIRPNRSDDLSSSGWLTKLVLDPASKLISYGADRFFSSMFRRKQLPPALEDAKDDVNDRVEDDVSDNQSREQVPDRGQHIHSPPIDIPSADSVSELEQLLKQKTFTGTQIIHLTELLRSKAKELSGRDSDSKHTTEMLLKLANDPLEENIANGVRSAAVSTPVLKSKLLDDNIASPAELAKSYMGSIPSKLSSPSLAMRNRSVRGVTGLLDNTPFASKSSNMSLSKKTFSGFDVPENGFISPRSRGMARTPYSRFYSASTIKGSGVMSNEYAGSSLTSASPYFVDHDDKLVKHTSLKRRNSFSEDGVGSIGPIRRIRQKTNLLAPRIHHAVTHSDVKHKGKLIGETMHDIEVTVKENENQSGPSTIYAHVPSKSSEVAARIFQQLEKLSPNGKSSESKIVAAREKSHSELKLGMFSGQALRSMENSESIKILFDGKDDHEYPNGSDSALTDAYGSSSKKQVNEVKNATRGFVTQSDALNCVINDAAPPLKASGFSFDVEKVNITQQLPKDNTFRMSARVSLEQNGDIPSNGLAQRPSSERGSMLEPFSDSKLLPAEQVKLKGRTEEKPSSFKINETGGPGTATSVTTASESLILPRSASASGKLKETNKPPPLFSFSSTVSDKFSAFSSESNKQKQEHKMNDSNSLFNFPASSSREMPSEPDKADHFSSVTAGVANAKSENTSRVQSNGPQFAKPLFGSFAAALSSDTNQTPVDGAAAVASFVPSATGTAVSSGASIFGSASTNTEPALRSGAPGDQITAISAAPSTNVSENLKRKGDNDSSSASETAFVISAPTSSASGTSALFSSFSNSTAGNLQSLPFTTSAPKSPVGSSAGTSSQVSRTDDTSGAIVEKGPSLNVFKFGMSSSASSDASSNSAPAPFIFSSNPFSSSSATAGTSSVTTPSTFGFGGNSSNSSPLANTASTFISGTSSVTTGTTSSPSNIFGSSWQGTKPFAFGSTTASLSPTTGLSFTASSTTSTSSQPFGFSIGPSSTPSASTNAFPSTAFAFGALPASSAPLTTSNSSPAAGLVFGVPSTPIASPSKFAPSSSIGFSFGASSTSVASDTPSSVSPFAASPASTSFTQPVFGAFPGAAFGASQGNSNDQMNGDDTMAEDTVQATPPSFTMFGQTNTNSGFSFGSNAPPQGNPFVFGGQQQIQAAPQYPSPFQESGSVQFNAGGGGGGFSLGSGGPGGGDKSGRKIVKINRNKNRKK